MDSLTRRAFLGSATSVLLGTGSASAQVSLWEGGRTLPGFPLYTQPDDISCGPTCCSMVLKWYGISAGIGPCKTKAQTRWFEAKLPKLGEVKVGMSHPDGIESCLESYGVPATVKRGSLEDITKYIDQDRPPILLVRSGEKTWHYVVAVGYSRGTAHFTLADPGGKMRPITGSTLDAAWTYSRDLYGGEIVGRKCRLCGGEGKIAKGWTKCAVCSGTGKISGFGFKTKCKACSGKGKWTSGGTNCVVCNGKGREPDMYRKAVESAKAPGHTLIVPNRGRRASKEPSKQPGKTGGNGFFKITVRNNTGKDLKVYFRYETTGGSWQMRTYTLRRGASHVLDAQTRNRYVYFRAEGSGYTASGGSKGKSFDGRKYAEVNMGSSIGTYTYTFNP